MKVLIVLWLILAMLAFGNTAGAGPLDVSMGDGITLKGGWNPEGYGSVSHGLKRRVPRVPCNMDLFLLSMRLGDVVVVLHPHECLHGHTESHLRGQCGTLV